jgi:hypothetical protein
MAFDGGGGWGCLMAKVAFDNVTAAAMDNDKAMVAFQLLRW